MIENKNYILNNFKLPGTRTIVILDGVYSPDLSDQSSDLVIKNNELVISENIKIETPIHLIFLSQKNYESNFDITAEKNSRTNIIEEHIGFKDKPCSSAIKINVKAFAESTILYQKIKFENIENSKHKVETNISQETGSKLINTLLSKEVKSYKENLHIKLEGEGASYENKSITLLKDQQNVTNKIRIEHLTPGCSSNVLAKSIIDDNATNNFDCRVIAHPNATNTKTHVTNKNLLLSDKATANTAPELEIYVDDVICTHGATVGQLDEDALFYLRSRGIEKENATKILQEAFIKEITDEILTFDRFKSAILYFCS